MFVKFLTSLSNIKMCRIIFCFDNYKHILEQVENKNVWVKLEKDGNKVNGYYSRNGENWFQVGQQVEISEKYKLKVIKSATKKLKIFPEVFLL